MPIGEYQWVSTFLCLNVYTHWMTNGPGRLIGYSFSWIFVRKYKSRDHFVYAPSQLETTLHCNVVSNWLSAYAEIVQVVEILSHGRQEPAYSLLILSWLLMTWCQQEPGHQQPWCWPRFCGIFHFHCNISHKLWKMFAFVACLQLILS